jgi:sec-independent protein translocase protein TatB
MFDVGFLEIAVILVVALVVIGPERMPEVARSVGKYVGKFRYFVSKMREETNFDQHTATLKREIEQAASTQELKGLQSSLTRSLGDIKDVVNPSDFMLSDAELGKLESGSYRNRYEKLDASYDEHGALLSTSNQAASTSNTPTPLPDKTSASAATSAKPLAATNAHQSQELPLSETEAKS